MKGSPVAASCSSRRSSAARGSFCSSLSSAPGSPAWPAQPLAPSSSAASSAATTPALRPAGSASPQLLGEPDGGARRSPKPGGWPGAGRGTHASEVKAQRLKATKNHMRSEMRDKGNLLFADLLHWLKSVEAVPLDRLAALVEEIDLPQICRLDFWGLPCPGCGLRHRSGAAAAGALPQSPARLWGGARQLAAKASPWMRSPPHLPGFSRQTLEEVDMIWAAMPDEQKPTFGDRVQFVLLGDAVIWGRDLGEESGSVFRAFLADAQRGANELEDFALPPPAADAVVDAASCTEDTWRRILALLPLREAARAGLALLASPALRESIGGAWDPHAVLDERWPRGGGGLGTFLGAARAAHLAGQVFSLVPPLAREGAPRQGAEAPAPCTGPPPWGPCAAAAPPPRSVAVSERPAALALSGGEEVWHGLLAVAAGRSVKLIRRYDMKSCGVLALRGCPEVRCMALSPDSSALAVAPYGGLVTGDSAVGFQVQLYSTGSKAKPVVVTFRRPLLTGLDFLCGEDLMVCCDTELCQVSSETGECVAYWSAAEAAALTACKAVGPHEVVTLAGSVVELWDLRTANGAARAVELPRQATSVDVDRSQGAPSTLVGDACGALRRIDWRAAACQAAAALWCAPPAAGAGGVHAVAARGGCACVVAGSLLTVLALEPQAVGMGSVRIEGRLSALAAGPGAWALAAHGARGAGSVVALFEPGGPVARPRSPEEPPDVGARKPGKMYRRSELKGNGHAMHARGAGKTSRSGRAGRR